MKKKLLLFLSFIAFSVNALALNVGDSFTKNGITYNVLSTTGFSVSARKASNAAAVGGVLTVPATVEYDDVTWSVSWVSLGDNIGDAITTIKISEGIRSLHSDCFYQGHNVTTVYLPASLTSIESFGSNNKISNVIIAEGNTKFVFEDGNLYSSDYKTLYFHAIPTSNPGYPDGKYIVRNSVEKIHTACFYLDKYIKELVLGDNIKEIAERDVYSQSIEKYTVSAANPYYKSVDGVLYTKDGTVLMNYPYAKADEDFVVPAGVTKIEVHAFNPINLKSLDLNEVVTVEQNAISSTSLETVYIHASTTNLNPQGLYVTNALQNIIIDSDHPQYVSEDGVIFNKAKTQLFRMPSSRTGSYTIPSTVTSIGSQAFFRSQLSSIVADANLSTIGNTAFGYATNLTSIDFSACNNLTSFGSNSFNNCRKLATITIPASLKSMGSSTFANCNSLTTVNIPDGSKLISIGSGSFKELANLTAVNFLGSCTLQTIQSRAFEKCTSLTSISLPTSVETIQANAFQGCTSLATVNIPNNSHVQTIASGAFADCGLESFTIPQSVTTIEDEAFMNCDVFTSITLPNTLTSFNSKAFKNCVSLAEVNVASDHPAYQSVDGILLSKDGTELVVFPPAKADLGYTLLPPTIESIAPYAFYNNSNLTNITLPAKVETIGDRAFGLCPNLNSVTFLGSSMVDPAGISQGENLTAFDVDEDGNYLGNITITARQSAKADYEANTFYAKLRGTNAVQTSATVGSEEYLPVSDNSVMLIGSTATEALHKIPSSVNIGGTNYAVALIGDDAFNGSTSKEIIVPASVTGLGFQAFANSDATNIIFFGNAVTAATETYNYPAADNEFNANQNIYVRKSQKDAFKASMPRFASKITNEIPFATPSQEYSTFSREFATDFSQGGSNTAANPKFIAFSSGVHEKNGDTETIVMHSINEGAAGDGTFIPANTGVVFKTYTSAPSYYEIADNQSASAISGIVVPVLEETTVSPGVGVQHYYIGKTDGKAHLIETATTIGAHKAYLKVTVSAGAKKVAFRFAGESNSATGINEVETASEKSEAIYNLNGQRVSGSARGILIRGGKKYINQ